MRPTRAALLLIAMLAHPRAADAQVLTLGPPLAEQMALSREDGARDRPEGYREVIFDDRSHSPMDCTSRVRREARCTSTSTER